MTTISNTTKEKYESLLKVIFKNRTIKLSGIQPFDSIYNRLLEMTSTKTKQKYSENSIKNFLNAMIYYLDCQEILNEKQKILRENIAKKVKEIMEKITKELGDNKLTDKQKKNYINWETVLKIYRKIKSNKDLSQQNHKEYVLLSLLVKFNGVRRAKDYSIMDIIDDKTKAIDLEKNYYVNSDVPLFIFNNYKTNKTFNKNTKKMDLIIQEFAVPRPLNNIIKEYINKYNVTGSLLELSQSNFKKYILDMFHRYISENVGVSLIRHAFITYIFKTTITKNEKEEIAKRMAHNLVRQLEYAKVDGDEKTTVVKRNNKKTAVKKKKIIYETEEEREAAKLANKRNWYYRNKEKNQ